MRARLLTGFIAAAGLFFGAAGVVAIAGTGAEADKDLVLRKIMKEMGGNMQIITDGISREDWALIEKTAPLIADHPQPPLTEKMRIIAFMGSDMGKFKGYDGETHKAAEALRQAALIRDGQEVIAAFQRLQTTCYSCHRDFRSPFVKHFYETR